MKTLRPIPEVLKPTRTAYKSLYLKKVSECLRLKDEIKKLKAEIRDLTAPEWVKD